MKPIWKSKNSGKSTYGLSSAYSDADSFQPPKTNLRKQDEWERYPKQKQSTKSIVGLLQPAGAFVSTPCARDRHTTRKPISVLKSADMTPAQRGYKQ